MKIPDIDLEIKNRDELLSKLRHIPAARISEDKIERHLTGVYFNDVPVDPLSGLCSVDFKQAEALGWMKVDLLHNNVYQKVRDKAHLRELVNREPTWELLQFEEVVQKLFQIHSYYDVLQEMNPRSLEEMAMTIAAIRPGKKHLLGKSWDEIRKDIWTKTGDGYTFKKSHAFAFAQVILVQLALIEDEMKAEL